MRNSAFSLLEVLVAFVIGTLALTFFLYYLTEVSYIDQRFREEISFLNEMNLWFFKTKNLENLDEDNSILIKNLSYEFQFLDRTYDIKVEIFEPINKKSYYLIKEISYAQK